MSERVCVCVCVCVMQAERHRRRPQRFSERDTTRRHVVDVNGVWRRLRRFRVADVARRRQFLSDVRPGQTPTWAASGRQSSVERTRRETSVSSPASASLLLLSRKKKNETPLNLFSEENLEGDFDKSRRTSLRDKRGEGGRGGGWQTFGRLF